MALYGDDDEVHIGTVLYYTIAKRGLKSLLPVFAHGCWASVIYVEGYIVLLNLEVLIYRSTGC